MVLQDAELRVAFDAHSGALTRMQRAATGWVIEERPELGVSFRLLAPLPGRRDNFVLGQKQRAHVVEKLSDNKVRLQWKDLESEHGGVLPMIFTATVTLENGALSFESALQNDSSLWVETIDYPYFGDLSSPEPGALMQAGHMWYGNLAMDEISPTFVNERGYWGTRYPLKTAASWQSLLCLIQAPGQGIYVGMHDPTQRYLLEFTFEQHPGVLQSIGASVPREDNISGIPVHLEFRTCHFVFAHPAFHRYVSADRNAEDDGDWHAGIDVYKEWRKTWFIAPKMPAWTQDVHSWLQLQLDTTEEDFSIPYREVVRYGEQCAANGVGAIQLVGWNRGGQDHGDPSSIPNRDWELGPTRETFR